MADCKLWEGRHRRVIQIDLCIIDLLHFSLDDRERSTLFEENIHQEFH